MTSTVDSSQALRDSVATSVPNIHGFVAQGFESVAEQFGQNFVERGDVGAAFAAYRDGQVIADLWGGIADRSTDEPWTRETLEIVFSGTKGFTAMCVLLLVDRGLLDLDAPIAHYWPEFAAAGKADVLVREVLSHTARLPGLDTPVTWQEATDDRRMAALLASQARSSDPRARDTYHALTYGWLCGELVRRIDGRSIGRFFEQEIAQKLDLEVWIGLPPGLESRVARVELAPSWGASPAFTPQQVASDPLLRSIFANPVRYSPTSGFPWNEPAWHAAEVPGANAIGSARSIARLYASLHQIVSDAALAVAVHRLSDRMDPVVGKEMAFGVGFQLQTAMSPFGPPPRAFGHGGSGGSRHGCWPDERVGFSYLMNVMRDDPADTRSLSLLNALYASLAETA